MIVDSFRKDQIENSTQIVAMKVEIELLKEQNKKMEKNFAARLNNLEQRTRINNIEIVGLTKPSPLETDTLVALNLLNNEIGANVQQEEIEALHEVLSKRKDDKRIVVVHFKHRGRRDEILALAKGKLRNYNKPLDSKDRIYINEHLSPENKRLRMILE